MVLFQARNYAFGILAFASPPDAAVGLPELWGSDGSPLSMPRDLVAPSGSPCGRVAPQMSRDRRDLRLYIYSMIAPEGKSYRLPS